MLHWLLSYHSVFLTSPFPPLLSLLLLRKMLKRQENLGGVGEVDQNILYKK